MLRGTSRMLLKNSLMCALAFSALSSGRVAASTSTRLQVERIKPS
jgi:hypothetical protein